MATELAVTKSFSSSTPAVSATGNFGNIFHPRVTTPAWRYLLSYDLFVLASGTGGSATAGFSWTDPDGNAVTTSSAPIDIATLGQHVFGVFPVITTTPASGITWNITISATAGAACRYNFKGWLTDAGPA